MIRVIKSRRMRWGDMWHSWSRRGIHAGLWWGILKEEKHVEKLGVDGRIIENKF
jgi:hypothetical protein